MARLAIRQVKYAGDKYFFESLPLPDGLIVVEGDGGTGKSTFADLIYFGLGGSVSQFEPGKTERHAEIVSDKNNSVSLRIEIDGQEYIIRRFFGNNKEALVSDPNGRASVFPIFRGAGDRKTLSDWLLERLGIDVVTLHFGAYSGKLGFTDLMRLMYHDQDGDPSRIYKKLTANNFVADSREFRRAIFEILTGRISQEYYAILGELRKIEKELAEAEGGLRQFRDLMERAAPGENQNVNFLRKALEEHEARLARLQLHRGELRRQPSHTTLASTEMTEVRTKLATAELGMSEFDRALNKIQNELIRLHEAKADLAEDIERIGKIIFAHETLSLFVPDTCPCCLREIERTPGKCICGSPVSEADFERFVYNSSEYMAILKSKQKNVETLTQAIDACSAERRAIQERRVDLMREAASLRHKLEEWTKNSTPDVYTAEHEKVDDQIVDLRVEVESLQRRFELEKRRDALDASAGRLRERRDELRRQVTKLEADAYNDSVLKLREFNKTYDQLMHDTDPDCHVARLDGNYMPVVNEGVYRESSSKVPRRLMYFLTLMHLSLTFPDVPFPRFLLIDTPETAGIDPAQLKLLFEKLFDVVESARVPCQAILTIGVGRILPKMSTKRILVLAKTIDGRLLKRTMATG